MSRFAIVPATAEHVPLIADRMRKGDADEVFAAAGKSPTEALEFSLARSDWSNTWLVDGRPEAMFGVADINILAGIAAPWLLGTDEVERHSLVFLRQSVGWRDQLLRRYAKLANFVDVRNVASIIWLRWLGFELSAPFTYRGYAFRAFELRAEQGGLCHLRYYHGADGSRNGSRRGRATDRGAGNGQVGEI